MSNFISKKNSIDRSTKVKELSKQGLSQKEISNFTGLTQGRISQIMSGIDTVKPYKYGHRALKIDPYRRIRREAMDALGNKCNQCGFSDSRALHIDHVNSDGAADRKIRKNYAIYKDVIVNPSRYQILCANCNWIKRYTNNEIKRSKYS